MDDDRYCQNWSHGRMRWLNGGRGQLLKRFGLGQASRLLTIRLGAARHRVLERLTVHGALAERHLVIGGGRQELSRASRQRGREPSDQDGRDRDASVPGTHQGHHHRDGERWSNSGTDELSKVIQLA